MHGVEPLVLYRSYHGIREEHLELSEEYRLFHNLFHDRAKNEFVKIADDGTEEIVARIVDGRWELRLRELRQYLAIRRMHLAIYFQEHRTSEVSPDDIPRDELRQSVRDGLTCYDFTAGAYTGMTPNVQSCSTIVGKKLIPPAALDECGIWPYTKADNHCTFIIGTDDDGNDIEHTCDPDALNNRFGTNPEAPPYLTPVFFRREVLTRYLSQSSKYSVTDGSLRCGDLWSVRIDNDIKDRVSVWLGDLGRDLPEAERKHWRLHNVTPDGARISKTNARRSFAAEFANAASPELAFKAAYRRLNESWTSRFGWPLFRKLHANDQHCFDRLQRLIHDEQSEFDDQIKNMTKVVVDALNAKALAANMPPGTAQDEKGIAKLLRWLNHANVPDADSLVEALKDLQAIRSRGAVHGKGSGYDQLWSKLGYQDRSLTEVFDDLLYRTTTMIERLDEWVRATPPGTAPPSTAPIDEAPSPGE